MELPGYIYMIGLCMVASAFWVRKKQAPLYIRLFPAFLFCSFLVELYANYIRSVNGNNLPLYNVFAVVEFAFYLFVLRSVIHSASVKQKMNWIILVFVILSLANLVIAVKYDGFQTITYATGSLLIVIYSIFYFYELFNLPQFIDLLHEPAFWLVSGLLYYYTCSYPLMVMINHLSRIPKLNEETLEFMFTWMNVLLYLIFTIAFICRIRIPKFISLS